MSMMSKRFRRWMYGLIFFLFPVFLSAQTVENFRITKNYVGRLDEILTEVGHDLNIRFIYEPTFLRQFNTSFMTDQEKTVGGILHMFRNSWDMVTLVGKDGFIYVAKDKEQLNQLLHQKEEVQEVRVIERKNLKPVKRNFLLSGEVVDEANGERIPFATVMMEGTTKGVSTDQNGHFALEKVPADTAVVVVSYLGYHTKKIELTPGKTNEPLHVEMKMQSVGITEVFINGRKDDKALQQSTLEQKIKMSPIALKILPNIGEKDIMRGFQLMPGVSAANEGSAGMYVRGGTPDQNLILYDGFTVYNVDHLYGFYSAFNSNAIKDVQLHKGGFDSKFGGRLSSVTEITGKDGNAKKPTIGAEVSLLSLNTYAELPIGDKITTLFAFRRSYQGYLYDKISALSKSSSATTSSRPFMGRNANTASYFYDLNGKITYNATKKDIYTLSIFNGTDYLDNTPQFRMREGGGAPPGGGGGGSSATMPNISMSNSDFSRYGNVGASARWQHKLSEVLSSSLLVSFSDYYSTRDERRSITVDVDGISTIRKSGILEDNNLLDFSIKNDWKKVVNDKNTLEFGGFGTWYAIDYTYQQNDTLTVLHKDIRAAIAGGYLQDKMMFLDNLLTVTPGLRLNYFTATNRFYPEPRLNASYKLSKNLTLNSATGLYDQFANRVVREDVMSGNRDFWILSNGKEIPVSSSLHFNMGLNYDLPDYLFSAEGYYKLNHNVTEYSMRYRSIPQPGSSVTSTEQFFTGNGYTIGMEFLAQKKAGNFNGWICYTLGQVKNRFPLQSDQYFFANQDVTHELKMVAIYKFGNFDFSASWIYATGRPYTAPVGAYTLHLIDGTTGSYYAVSDKNSYRLPDYHRMDIAASYRFDLFGKKGKLNSIGLSVFNLYNRINVSSRQFQIVDDTILQSDISYLGITPNLTLSLKF
ncbi:MAG: TonB-dependent receptor [Marinilabiliales bacterium]|nr:TonB-dependent receptor [Marinilabiliales bacterium]